MGILEAIGGFFAGAVHGVADVLGKVKAAIRSVVIFASTVFDLVGGAWDWMVNGVGWLGNNVIGFAARVWHLVEHLALTVIPRAVAWALGHAVRWAKRAVFDLSSWIKAALGNAVKWARGAINAVLHYARNAIRLLTHTVVGIWDWLERAGRRAADLVLHPQRLVAWILGALVLPLLRFFIEASAPLLVWLFRAFRREAVAFAHTIEDVLAKVV